MLSSILVPLDGSARGAPVVPLAARLGRATGAELRLVQLVPPAPPAAASRAVAARISSFNQAMTGRVAAHELRQVAQRLGGEQVHVRTSVREGPPGQVILEELHTRRADLIVMTTDRRSALGRVAPDSVAAELLRQGAGPLLLVPPSFGAFSAGASAPPRRRLVVALDGSSVSEAVLGPAVTLASVWPGELLLLQVLPPPDFRTPVLDRALARRAAHHYLEAMAEQVGRRQVPVTTRVVEGTPAVRISTLAQEVGAQVIALSTHGRSGQGGVVLGRVASGTLQRSAAPVLLLRPEIIPPEPFPTTSSTPS